MDVKLGSLPDNYKIPKEELDEAFKGDNFDISKYTDELVKQAQKNENRMVVDDIIAISLGMYQTYDDYAKSKQQMIEDAQEMNRNNMILNSNYLKFTYFVQPLIIDRDTFDYIVKKYRSTGARENEELCR